MSRKALKIEQSHHQIPQPTNQRNLLLTLDAFGTLFHPREPIEKTYADHARARNIDIGPLDDPATLSRLLVNFKKAYADGNTRYPNYGHGARPVRDDVTARDQDEDEDFRFRDTSRGPGHTTRGQIRSRRRGGGGFTTTNWWEYVIQKTFAPYFQDRHWDVPKWLASDLINYFASDRAYELYPDVLPLFARLREAKQRTAEVAKIGGFDNVVVGVISNSDTRVPQVLSQLGLKVGPWRAGHKLRVQPNTPPNRIYDVDFVVTSYHARAEKPDPFVFQKAKGAGREVMMEMQLGWWKDGMQIVHVGDDYRNDYEGANESNWWGWKGVMLARGEEAEMEERVRALEKGVDRVSSLEEVPGLFRRPVYERPNPVRKFYVS